MVYMPKLCPRQTEMVSTQSLGITYNIQVVELYRNNLKSFSASFIRRTVSIDKNYLHCDECLCIKHIQAD